MNREDIIRMAREAGLTGLMEGGLIEYLERFAALVAAAEKARTVVAAFEVSERQIAAEREKCASICDREANFWKDDLKDWARGFYAGAKSSAHEIRARGKE
jgi:hypothetical protein